MQKIISCFATLVLFLTTTALAAEPLGLTNPFYAMDTSFQRPGLSPGQQFDLVKELGFAGVAWHEQGPEQVISSVQELEKRGLKMFTIYCPATVTPEGALTTSPGLGKLMEALKGKETIIWLHVGGKGPAFASLTGEEPAVKKLRELAEQASQNSLRIALYPHVGEWTARFADATRLAKLVNHPSFGVTFNLCHALAMGEEQQFPELLEQAKPVLMTVTLSGADSGVTGGKWDRLIQTLDKGTFDQAIVLGKLKQIGFKGPIGFQGYAIKGDARSILTPTMEAWRKLNGTK
jgi:sugar phosphate isomerase/epimerase